MKQEILMKKVYLIFNIKNNAEEYRNVFEFCDKLDKSSRNVNLPDDLVGKVYIYQGEESDSMEKIFSVTAKEIKRGGLNRYEEFFGDISGKYCGCLRIAHEVDDATIEYIYLAALLYKFPQLICFLYSEGDEKQKYAVLNKASEFFYGFSKGDYTYHNRIFSENYNYKDGMWQIKKLVNREADHFKIHPVIMLDESRQEVQFWRTRLKVYKNNLPENTNRLKKILERCRKDFIEEYKRKAIKRENYYENIFKSKKFCRETADMPLLAFYLFCMQMFYLKDGRLLDEEEIKRIRLNAWDVADGILQLMENIHHSTEKIGFLDIRVHENKPEKSYLSKRYKITDSRYPFYYEIRLLDLSHENIVESFQKRMGNISETREFRVSDFFKGRNDNAIDEFWKKYNQQEENLVHHYGLQVFSSIVSANDGAFKVISSSKYELNREREIYVNGESWSQGSSGMAHLPGTEYIVLLPLRGQEQKFVTSMEVNIEYQYDMETDYKVQACSCISFNSENGYESQEQKELLINEVANYMFEKLQELDRTQSAVLVTLFSIKEWMAYPLEIYCKALILCGIWWKLKCKDKFHCIINECTENEILEIARLFAIFYCKMYLPEYLVDMQIYLAGENEEFLITGDNLGSLYAITSKIMLVKGINKETANIMRYLLGQYGAEENGKECSEQVSLVPFDTLELSDAGTTLFERNVIRTLNADIQRHSLGCKIHHTHMRIGSKLHIQSFFEAELLFHNNYYISRFANIILKKLPIDYTKKTILVGYETYSELLLYKIVMELMNKNMSETGDLYQASYMIYEQRTGGKFRYMDTDCLNSDKGLQFAIIIPINSTLTTHNKVRDALEEELRERNILRKGLPQIIANYALILIRSSEGEKCDELEGCFWEGIKGKKIKTHLIPEGEPDVEFFVCVQTKWYSPLQCPDCFPEKYIDEKPLIETNRASIVPVQMLGIMEPDLISIEKRALPENNLDRVKALKDSLIYKHIIRNGNHYLYYFCLEHYFIQEREKIIRWLKEEKSRMAEVKDRIVYDIIVSPLHYSIAGFLAEVNHYMFDNAALVLNFEVEKEFRENVKTKYSNIIGLYYNLLQMKRRALIRFHFVDDTVVSGKTITRARTLFQSLICPVNEEVKIEVFSDIVVILNRMSQDSISSLIGNDITPDVNRQRLDHFHAYVNLNISSMRNHEDACTECKHVTNFTKLRDQSSTNRQYKFWNERIGRHLPKEIQSKMQEEFLNGDDERRERAYRRLICTHIMNERLGELGFKKNDTEQVKSLMIELFVQPQDDQIEWVISYVKVFSRPFVSFLKSNREAIFRIMLLVAEYIVKELTKRKKGIPRQYKEIKTICSYIWEQHQKKDEPICRLLIVLVKRLSDLGSNYAIRKENIIGILKTVDNLNISESDKQDFRNRYIGVIKSVCCQSSDENKSVYFEYMLLYGEEYGKLEKINEIAALGSERLLLGLSVEEEFAEIAFLENTRVLSDGIRDLAKDNEKFDKKDLPRNRNVVELLQQYYYDNFRKLLCFYGYWDMGKQCITEQGKELLGRLVELYQYLGGEVKSRGKERKEKDAEIYYKMLLEILEKLTGAERCYFLYGTDPGNADSVRGTKRYYRIQANKDLEHLSISNESLGIKRIVADTYVPAFCVENDGVKLKRSIIKYDIYNENDITLVNAIFLQLDFPEQLANRRILIALKMVMVFHNMILQHLKWDFSNNMIQKWSAKEYFNKQIMLQRATDHTDRDNLLKYYNEISHIYEYKDADMRQLERDRALFHMVINSYIARMNIQILAGANPERERSKAAFVDVYRLQLRPLIKSLHVIEAFQILDENGEETFSESLLGREIRLRQTELKESLSYRRISIIVIELILSAINYSRKDKMSYVYIYRENEYLVVKNQFYSRKGIKRIKQDIQDSVERKKDGISLATIKGIVNACYGLDEKNGVIIDAAMEERRKFFYVKLPILHMREG